MGRGYAVGAGMFGSLGAVFGKVTFEEDGVLASLAEEHAVIGLWVFRVVSFGMIFVPNAGMWGCFNRALALLPSVEATLINTASNLVFSALWGALLFDEALSTRWLLGSLSIGLGLVCMMLASVVDPQVKEGDVKED